MTTIEIFETGNKAEIPSSWDEMTSKQVRGIFRLADESLMAGASPLEFSIRALYFLLGLKFSRRDAVYVSLSGEEPTKLDENIYLLCDRCLGFLFADGDKAQLGFDSVRNPMRKVRVGMYKLIGPADLLQDLTFGEFRLASAALNAFFKSGDIADMDECIAYLYRRPYQMENKAGRFVRPITNSGFGIDMEIAGRMQPWQKNLIMMWFASCLRCLQTKVVTVDGEDIDMALLFAGEESKGGPAFGWNDLLIEVAKQQAIGTVEQVDAQPLFTVLAIMWHNYKENKRYDESRSHSSQ